MQGSNNLVQKLSANPLEEWPLSAHSHRIVPTTNLIAKGEG